MELRVVRTGNSFALLLPKAIMERLNLSPGDKLFAAPTPSGYVIDLCDPDLVEAMRVSTEAMHEDKDLLRALAKL